MPTPVSPFLQIRCPYCREKFHPGDCSIYSTTTPGKLLRQAPQPGSIEHKRSRVLIDALSGPEYTTELARRQCPNPECHQLLFDGIETCDNINIAIVGDTFSGKTHYMAVLIDLLKRGVFIQYDNTNTDMSFIPLNQKTDETYRGEYAQPILQNHVAVAANQPGIYDANGKPQRTEPLVFQLNINDPTHSCHINILLYDLSGEDIANDARLVQFGEHVLRADGIIYLANPWSMPFVWKNLPPYARPKDEKIVTGRTTQEVLTTLVYRLGQYHKAGPGGKVRTPTAIVLSKFDLFQFVMPPAERKNYLLLQPPNYDGKVHLAEIQRINEEVRFCLQACQEDMLLRTSRNFTDVSFFAVSATGSAPDPDTGKYASIMPHRCLDPFIWLLWKLGYVGSK